MKHFRVFIGLGLWLAAASVQAQVPFVQSRSYSQYGNSGSLGTVGQPTFSPYLNLLRRGNSTLSNYYGLVRPQQQFQSANEQFQSEFNQVQRQFNSVESNLYAPPLQATGHRVRFMSHLSNGTGSIAGFRPTGPAALTSGVQRPLIPPSGHSVYFGNQGAWFSANPALRRR
ncbi:MAG: hypothetical protein O3B13_17590 [Planctomycetota bacterium]|nr:hypothetical protein [Planctomycetota bacterium]